MVQGVAACLFQISHLASTESLRSRRDKHPQYIRTNKAVADNFRETLLFFSWSDLVWSRMSLADRTVTPHQTLSCRHVKKAASALCLTLPNPSPGGDCRKHAQASPYFAHLTSVPATKPEPPINPRHSNVLSAPRCVEVAESDIQTGRQRLVARVSSHSSRRLTPLVVEERVVTVGAAIDGPLRWFDPLAEVVTTLLDGTLNV